jgi:hypothetical protein
VIYLVRSIRGDVDGGSAWLPALLLGNVTLGLGRLHLDRKVHQAGDHHVSPAGHTQDTSAAPEETPRT